MKIPEKTPAAEIFTQFCVGYKKRDLNTLLNLFTKNTNMWGSGLDEYRVGIKEVEIQLKRDWSQSTAGEIEIVSLVPTTKDSLWMAAICKAKVLIDGKEHIFEHLRGTITIAKEDGVWKIAHMHASFPDYRNAVNGSFPVEAM